MYVETKSDVLQRHVMTLTESDVHLTVKLFYLNGLVLEAQTHPQMYVSQIMEMEF